MTIIISNSPARLRFGGREPLLRQWLLLFQDKHNLKKYIFYIDGFNLYYRLKHTKYKWLNIKALVESLNFRDCEISKIRYFTAKVNPIKNDPNIGVRQNFYLQALETIPEIEIHFGQFRKRTVKGKLLAAGNPLHKKIVEISKFEEKGSDVNIATFMLTDCFQEKFDVPILLSNDSDLTEPLKYIKITKKKPVGLISPTHSPVKQLKRYSTIRRKITEQQLAAAQFPHQLKDQQGDFFCPNDWR